MDSPQRSGSFEGRRTPVITRSPSGFFAQRSPQRTLLRLPTPEPFAASFEDDTDAFARPPSAAAAASQALLGAISPTSLPLPPSPSPTPSPNSSLLLGLALDASPDQQTPTIAASPFPVPPSRKASMRSPIFSPGTIAVDELIAQLEESGLDLDSDLLASSPPSRSTAVFSSPAQPRILEHSFSSPMTSTATDDAISPTRSNRSLASDQSDPFTLERHSTAPSSQSVSRKSSAAGIVVAQPTYDEIREWFCAQRGWAMDQQVVTTKQHPFGTTDVTPKRRKSRPLFTLVKPFGRSASQDVGLRSVFISVHGLPFTIPLRALLTSSTYRSHLTAFVLAHGAHSGRHDDEANELWMEVHRSNRHYTAIVSWILSGARPTPSSAAAADGLASEAALLGLSALVHLIQPLW